MSNMARGVYKGLLGDENRVDYLFRISLKAVIFDKSGKLLVTNETGRPWHLPGGGLEHGESIEQGLKRELAEETGYMGQLKYKVIGAEPSWSDELNMWQMWIVVEAKIDSFDFMDDRTRLIDPEELVNSTDLGSQLTYKYAQTVEKR